MGPNIGKLFSWKKIIFFYKKIVIYLSVKDSQATGETLSPQKRTCSTSKHETSAFFFYFLGYFCPPGSGSGSIRPKSMWIGSGKLPVF
jgi:hypothetical protein